MNSHPYSSITFTCPTEQKSGVYVLRLKGAVVYVGQSHNVFLRVGSHNKKDFDEVEIIWAPRSELGEIEYQMICLHKPPFNNNTPARAHLISYPEIHRRFGPTCEKLRKLPFIRGRGKGSVRYYNRTDVEKALGVSLPFTQYRTKAESEEAA